MHWNVRRIFLSVCQVKWQLSKKKAVSAVAATFASITNKQSDTHTRVHVCTYVCMYLYMYLCACPCMHTPSDCVRYMTMCCVRVYSTHFIHSIFMYKVCLSPLFRCPSVHRHRFPSSLLLPISAWRLYVCEYSHFRCIYIASISGSNADVQCQ